MTRALSFPYLRPASESIRLIGASVDWPHVEVTGDELSLSGWDPGTSISVLATVELDPLTVLESTKLSPADALRLVIVWFCPLTALKGSGKPVDVDLGVEPGSTRIELVAEMPGYSLAGRVEFQVQAVLADKGQSKSPLAAQLPGSLLWTAGRHLILEGRASRFPVESVNFTTYSSLADSAGWHLEWDRDDLMAPVHGRLRLLVNSENTMVRDAVAAPDGSPENRAIMGMMEYSIARALITGALASDDFVEAPEQYPEGSVGAAVRRLMLVAFPHSNPREIAAGVRSRPDRFDSDLQAGLRVFGGIS